MAQYRSVPAYETQMLIIAILYSYLTPSNSNCDI
jgi:hypothetical protein